MSKSIKQILIRRDNLTSTEANEVINEAREAFLNYLADNDQYLAENICEEYFGLEPDYLDELL